MAKMKMQLRSAGKVKILDLNGPLTTGVGNPPVGRAIKELLEAGVKKIVLNLKHVRRIDSGGLGLLIASKKWSTEKGADVVLLMPSKEVYDLLVMVKLNDVFDLYDDELEAVGSV